jgi:hypothetical protein
MKWSKVVIPAKAGIQPISNLLKTLDSRLHGNDPKEQFSTFDESIMIEAVEKPASEHPVFFKSS